jgi:hypothetical protein
MFGNKRRNAIKVAVENIRPLLATYQHTYGTPAHFWTDDFVLGFVGYLAAYHMHHATQGTLSQVDKGHGLSEVLTQLSNLNGMELAKRFTEHVAEDSPAFAKGGDNAAVIASYIRGTLRNEDMNEDVQRAKKTLEGTGKSDRSSVAAILAMQLFYDVLRERFAERG